MENLPKTEVCDGVEMGCRSFHTDYPFVHDVFHHCTATATTKEQK